MMQTIAESGACLSGASAVHMNIFGLMPVVVFGTKEQQARMLPPLIAGKDKSCFAVTEPNTGLNTTQLKTKAVKMSNGNYAVSGQKIWISTAQVANKVLLLCRTTPLENVKKKTDGLSLFYTDFDRKKIEVREIPKMGRHAVDSNMVYFDNVEVPAADLIGKEGDGFKQILHGMNPERILVAAEAIGIGRAALKKAAKYARERIVFDRPIGQNQGIQHPLAQAWMNLEAANLMVFKAAALYDKGEDCGVEANAAKYLAGEAGFNACQTSMMSMGGMGYAKEYHVERYLRESFISRIAPDQSPLDHELYRRARPRTAAQLLSVSAIAVRRSLVRVARCSRRGLRGTNSCVPAGAQDASCERRRRVPCLAIAATVRGAAFQLTIGRLP